MGGNKIDVVELKINQASKQRGDLSDWIKDKSAAMQKSYTRKMN